MGDRNEFSYITRSTRYSSSVVAVVVVVVYEVVVVAV